MADLTPACGAQAWRTVTIEGLLRDRVIRSPELSCELQQGHSELRHSSRMAVFTGVGESWAEVQW